MTAVILQFAQMARKRTLETPPNRIRELRERAGLTQTALAEQIGTQPHQISRLETGERELTVPWMRRIAKSLGVAPAELFVLEEQGLSETEQLVVRAMREADDLTRRMIVAPAREALAQPSDGAEGKPKQQNA